MSFLDKIQRGKQNNPPRIVLYGTEGIGKSTFAASAPNPIFIQTEDGLDQIDCDSFPLAKSWMDVEQYVAALIKEEHDYKTVVIDTVDWLERLIWDHICKVEGVKSIERACGGYAKGYTEAVSYWSRLTNGLMLLRNKGMAVVLLAHSQIEKFEDPEHGNYDRYAPRLHKKANAFLCEWVDAVLFASRRIITKTEDAGFNRERTLAQPLGANGGERFIRTIGGPNCVAKNRYNLPETIDLSWSALMQAMKQSNVTTQEETPDNG